MQLKPASMVWPELFNSSRRLMKAWRPLLRVEWANWPKRSPVWPELPPHCRSRCGPTKRCYALRHSVPGLAHWGDRARPEAWDDDHQRQCGRLGCRSISRNSPPHKSPAGRLAGQHGAVGGRRRAPGTRPERDLARRSGNRRLHHREQLVDGHEADRHRDLRHLDPHDPHRRRHHRGPDLQRRRAGLHLQRRLHLHRRGHHQQFLECADLHRGP